MKLSLQITGSQANEPLELNLGQTTTIGRKRNNRLQINEIYVSSRHAVITRSESGIYFLEDCESTNGTFINDQAITGATPIKAGDVIRFGLASCSVQLPESPESISSSRQSNEAESSDSVAVVKEGNWRLYPDRSSPRPAFQQRSKSQRMARIEKKSKAKKAWRASQSKAGRTSRARSYGLFSENSGFRRH